MDSMPERERPVSGPTQISTQVNEGERERGGGREGRERVREGGGETRSVGGRGEGEANNEISKFCIHPLAYTT